MASTVTATVTDAVTHILTTTVTSSTSTSTNRATPQGGILEGGNPSKYDPKNPIIMFIIQAGIIIIFCRLLHYPLSKLRQPRVIAEVIGGILLGPSVMGRIPGFTNAIFPTAATPNLIMVANLGLILFLFLVGLEVDLRFLTSNWKVALTVLSRKHDPPFRLGCAVSYGLYNEFKNDSGVKPVAFGTFMLFIGVAMAITAFPVLCRILTELKLLSTPVGVIVLSAGVGNDVVGWILLALCVALVNSGSGLTALWVLLVAFGYTLFLFFAIRPVFLRILKKTGSLQNGPTQGVMALTILMALASAFFTGIIGIHPIFGAFMVGLICPHESAFAIRVTEKVEDLVSVLLLPLYFASSGLNTNLGLLNTGMTWAYVVAVIAIAFSAKMTGATLASRLCGLLWRESFTVGSLMSCKGLVELIVLNIGLQAKILSTRTFTMFVVMALVTTCATTPLTSALYPEWYQRKLELWKKGKIDWDGNPLHQDSVAASPDLEESTQREAVRKMLVYLRLDALPGLFTFISLMGHRELTSSSAQDQDQNPDQGVQLDDGNEFESALKRRKGALEVQGLRLVELTERTSSVMQVSEIQEYANHDPVVKAFRTFCQFVSVAAAGSLAVVPERSFATTLLERAIEVSTDLVLIPWSENGSMNEQNLIPAFPDGQKGTKFLAGTYNSFVSSLFPVASAASASNVPTTQTPANIGIFIDRGFSLPSASWDTLSNSPGESKRPSHKLQRTETGVVVHANTDGEKPTLPHHVNRTYHVIVAYVGGEDDEFGVKFATQLAKNENVSCTIIHFTTNESTLHADHASTFLSDVREGLSEASKDRVSFSARAISSADQTSTPESQIRETLHSHSFGGDNGTSTNGDLVILGRRSGMASGMLLGSTNGNDEEIVKTLGSLATTVLSSENYSGSVLVVQAASRPSSRASKTAGEKFDTLAATKSNPEDDDTE